MSDAQLDRAAQGLGALGLIIIFSTCCLVPDCRGGRNDRDDMRACAEACGTAGMSAWERLDGCTCREVRP